MADPLVFWKKSRMASRLRTCAWHQLEVAGGGARATHGVRAGSFRGGHGTPKSPGSWENDGDFGSFIKDNPSHIISPF